MGMGIGERKKVDVSWLRRTEYLSSEGSNKPAAALAYVPAISFVIIVLLLRFLVSRSQMKTKADTAQMSPEERAAAITASFELVRAPLSDLRHPSKPHLRAESAYDVLPDADLWANGLNLVRFGEDPGETKVRTHIRTLSFKDCSKLTCSSLYFQAGQAQGARADSRLPRAIFRPVEIPGEPGRIGYFLPQDEDTAAAYALRREQGEDGNIDGELFDFKHVRDYEIATSRVLNNEFVFCFEEGDPPVAPGDDEPDRPKAKRPRGAYFTSIDQAQTLRKRRPRVSLCGMRLSLFEEVRQTDPYHRFPQRGEDPTEFPEELTEQGIVFWDGIAVQVS